MKQTLIFYEPKNTILIKELKVNKLINQNTIDQLRIKLNKIFVNYYYLFFYYSWSINPKKNNNNNKEIQSKELKKKSNSEQLVNLRMLSKPHNRCTKQFINTQTPSKKL